MARHHNREQPGSGGQRQLRVAELIRHALSDLLTRGEVHDPVLEGHMVTVPEVRMSPDLRLATAYVMPLGGRDKAEVIEALERNKKYLRGEISHRVNLKFSPDLRFRLDERFDEAERIEKLLQTPVVRRDLEKQDPDPADPEAQHSDADHDADDLDTSKPDVRDVIERDLEKKPDND
jgi:ribosome-binding factor A